MKVSVQLDDSHSVYLLGQSSSSLFDSYRSLMKACAQQGEFLSFETTPEWLSCYERDAQHLYSKRPLLVFRPHTIASIAPFLQGCYQRNIPITARCGGTGLVGSCVPSTEGVVLLTGHLKNINNYDAKRGIICLEPGVTVRMLNQYVAADHWFFPLSMATEGVAGLAGCLSSQARGYHQQDQSIFDAIQNVTLVDGQGQILEVPSALVCGAEGLWGVVIEMRVQLKKIPSQCYEFFYRGSWQDVLTQLSPLRSLHSLTSLEWSEDIFYLRVEGESWRMDKTETFLSQILSGLQKISSSHQNRHSFFPSQKPFIVLSSACRASQLPEACEWALTQAEHLELKCLQHAGILAGSLQIVLQSAENFYDFSQKVEQFFVLWVDFLDRQQGVLANCHGVGMQMRPYMTPFWSEETQHMWRRMQTAFDPKGLFGKERFFPPFGKSLEKMRQESS